MKSLAILLFLLTIAIFAKQHEYVRMCFEIEKNVTQENGFIPSKYASGICTHMILGAGIIDHDLQSLIDTRLKDLNNHKKVINETEANEFGHRTRRSAMINDPSKRIPVNKPIPDLDSNWGKSRHPTVNKNQDLDSYSGKSRHPTVYNNQKKTNSEIELKQKIYNDYIENTIYERYKTDASLRRSDSDSLFNMRRGAETGQDVSYDRSSPVMLFSDVPHRIGGQKLMKIEIKNPIRVPEENTGRNTGPRRVPEKNTGRNTGPRREPEENTGKKNDNIGAKPTKSSNGGKQEENIITITNINRMTNNNYQKNNTNSGKAPTNDYPKIHINDYPKIHINDDINVGGSVPKYARAKNITMLHNSKLYFLTTISVKQDFPSQILLHFRQEDYLNMLGSNEAQKRFVKSLQRFTKSYKFNGSCLDFELATFTNEKEHNGSYIEINYPSELMSEIPKEAVIFNIDDCLYTWKLNDSSQRFIIEPTPPEIIPFNQICSIDKIEHLNLSNSAYATLNGSFLVYENSPTLIFKLENLTDLFTGASLWELNSDNQNGKCDDNNPFIYGRAIACSMFGEKDKPIFCRNEFSSHSDLTTWSILNLLFNIIAVIMMIGIIYHSYILSRKLVICRPLCRHCYKGSGSNEEMNTGNVFFVPYDVGKRLLNSQQTHISPPMESQMTGDNYVDGSVGHDSTSGITSSHGNS